MKNPKNMINDLTPKEIVSELNKYIIGQDKAKKAVAIALRNRTRRLNVDSELREEISPKNIIMIGATGVGKTEIARRLAKLTDAPFIKIEATKFTEIGYVGRDVESMIRDLAHIAVNQEKEKARDLVKKEAEELVEEKILDYLFPDFIQNKPDSPHNQQGKNSSSPETFSTTLQLHKEPHTAESNDSKNRTREKMRIKLQKGEFENKYIEIDNEKPQIRNTLIEFSPENGMEQMDSMLQNIMGSMGNTGKTNKMKIKNARRILMNQMTDKLIDNEKAIRLAIHNVENSGIVFLDEIDKIASHESAKSGNVSREGVQRDILPIVEGSTVNTRFGPVKTQHILFIAAGAFHSVSPSDLIPELQGRFPIRVELDTLTAKDLEKILSETKNSLLKQYSALLKTEGIDIKFKPAAIREIAKIAGNVNQRDDNIGARRLSTIMEKLLEEILFDAPNIAEKKISIDKKDVNDKLSDIVKDKDLSKYIL